MPQPSSFGEHLAAARKQLEGSRETHYLSAFEESTAHLRGVVEALGRAIDHISSGGEATEGDRQVFEQFQREMEAADALNQQAGAIHCLWADLAREQLGLHGGYASDGSAETYTSPGRIAIEA